MSKRTMSRLCFSPALLLGSLLTPVAASAQAPSDAPVSVSAVNAPVATVLRSLFRGASVRFVIDDSVQGNVNADLSAVPFPVALKQVLGSIAVPLTFSIENGVYHVQVKQAAAMPVGLPILPPALLPASPSEDAGPFHFYKIGIQHYDPGVIAELLTHLTGIVEVPPNFVIPSGANASSGITGPTVTTVRPPSAYGPAVPFGGTPALTGPQSAPVGANSVLPDGVKRIFVRHSDNSLVIEATPEGMAQILPLIKETN